MHIINYHNNSYILSVVLFLSAVNIKLCTHFTALKNSMTDKIITGVWEDGKVSMEKKAS